MVLLHVVYRMLTKNQHTPCSTGVEETVDGFVEVTEAIISKHYKRPLFAKQYLHNLFLLRRDEW